MALDAEKRPSRALASNQGHLLWAGAVPRERAARVRDALMSEAMFSGWGIRTLARGESAHLMQWGFGLNAEGFERRLRIIRPSLPHWVNRVAVPGIPVAGASIDLCFERAGGQVKLSEARIDGDVEVCA